jgi:signal transduction histidine kinase
VTDPRPGLEPTAWRRLNLVAFLGIAAVVTVFLAVAQVFRSTEDIAHERAKAVYFLEQGLILIGQFSRESLAKGRYQDVEQFLSQWVLDNPAINELRAVAPNGFAVVDYRRAEPAVDPIAAEYVVRHNETPVLSLRAVTDFYPVHRRLRAINQMYVLGIAGFGIAISLVAWLAVRRLALAPLAQAKADLDATAEQLARSNASLRQAALMAEEASTAKSKFLAGVSHELRTPLNAIIGFSDMLRMEPFGKLGDPHYREYAGHINEAGRHLLAIINDILDASKIEAGALELEEELIDIAAVAENILPLVRDKASASGVTLSVSLPPGLPALRADGRRVAQILLNLLSNAVKFTPPGGRVEVTAALDAAGGIVLSVADTGIGIAAKDITLVLAPFGQVANAMSRQHTGTGLGLPLTKALVELHGGEMTLDSTPGVGTTVRCRFPARRTVARRSGELRIDAVGG